MASAPRRPNCRRRGRSGRRLPLLKRSNVCAGGGPREGRGRGVGRGGLIANGSGYVDGGRDRPASGADPRKRQKLGTASLLSEGSFVATSSSGLVRFLPSPLAPARHWIQPGRESWAGGGFRPARRASGPSAPGPVLLVHQLIKVRLGRGGERPYRPHWPGLPDSATPSSLPPAACSEVGRIGHLPPLPACPLLPAAGALDRRSRRKRKMTEWVQLA